MPLIMTQNASVQCPHGGTGVNIPSQTKVLVNGYPVMVDGDRGQIIGCSFVPPAGQPCLTYDLNSMKLNSAFIDSKNLMLVTDVVMSQTGFPLMVSETHPVEDNSTPAPLSPGEAPSIPPFLLNVIKPLVDVLPPLGAFSKSSSTPLFVTFTFNLSSVFPFQWKLTKVNKQNPNDVQDLTNDMKVVPRGGEWTSNNTSIVLTMPSLYMSSLDIGDHFFVMTGIDQRGNSNYAQAKLKVEA